MLRRIFFSGLEASYGVRSDGVYFTGGIHQSEIEGKASITIGGTTHMEASADGMGYLFGGGIEQMELGMVQHYGNLGGVEDTSLFILFYGVKF